jgi:hypothetical protein
MFHVCVQVDENDVSLIWISNNNNMRLMLLLYRQVKGSLPGKIYLGEGKVRGRLILFLLWIGSSAWNISRTFVKGEIHDGSAIRVVPSRSTPHESRAPPNFVCTGTLVDYGSCCCYYTGVQRAKVKGKKQKIIFFTLRAGGKLTHCFRACCLWARPII